MLKSKIKVKDKVQVLAGKDKGKIGVVKKIIRKKDRVIVDQINLVKRHVKGNPYTGQAGGIQEKEAPIHISNLAVICNSCSKATRVGYRLSDDGKKVRYCKKCNDYLD